MAPPRGSCSAVGFSCGSVRGLEAKRLRRRVPEVLAPLRIRRSGLPSDGDITGDARNNYRDSGAETLRLIHQRARKVYWLNPESRRDWDATDSIMDAYTSACHGVFEARNLRQLAEFVYQIT